jgi:hypothetical protein
MEDDKKVGRPKLFKTPEELEEKINTYFYQCKEEERPYTMSGLAFALGIDRKTLINYGKDEEFFHTIKKARDFVEQYVEERLLTQSGVTTGVIFNLKNNFDWKDKQEIDANVKTQEIRVELED